MVTTPPPTPGQPPTTEQLIQFVMLVRGLNREAATEDVMADQQKVTDEWNKVKQLVDTGQAPTPQPPGGGAQQASGSGSSQHEQTSGQHHRPRS